MICVSSIEGCADCVREDKYKESIGHRCGASDPRWLSLCQMRRELRIENPGFHRRTHEPVRCSECEAVLDDHLGNTAFRFTVCPSILCSVTCCSYCGSVESSSGPVDCPTCGSLGRRPGVSRIRRQYRAKRGRFW